MIFFSPIAILFYLARHLVKPPVKKEDWRRCTFYDCEGNLFEIDVDSMQLVAEDDIIRGCLGVLIS